MIMSVGETRITVIGNLTADPRLFFSRQGVAVVNFTVAASRRTYDKAADRWVDSDTLFLRCSAFRQLAENIAESLTKGARVVVTGRLRQHGYEDKEGIWRTAFEVDVEDVGPSLRWATAQVTKAPGDGDQMESVARSATDPWAFAAASSSPVLSGSAPVAPVGGVPGIPSDLTT
nr:single-stranded DNA-binding protein [Microbispora cellulosiformans]